MVVISSPSTVPICLEQERIAFPFCSTVQAPHKRHAAAEFCSGQSEDVAQVPQQRHFRIAIESLGASVHLEMNHRALPGTWVGKFMAYCYRRSADPKELTNFSNTLVGKKKYAAGKIGLQRRGDNSA